MFFSPIMKISFKIFMSVLSLIILFSIKSPKNILLTPLIEQIYGLYQEEELISGIVDRVINDHQVIVLIETDFDEIIIHQSNYKKLKSGDVVNLIKVDETYKLVNVNEIETRELQKNMKNLMQQLRESDG
ncbi:MAG TPA: hypothetical protein VK121_00215 [Pseudogracilibacillus sp.]|nr:hypothetical protein [Pseudogracilibacillus sp.]